MNTNMRNTYLAVGILVVILVIIAFVVVRTRLPQFNLATTPSPTPTTETQTESVTLGVHTPASTAVVDSVTLGKPGFVAIHEMQNGEAGGVLGASSLLPAGTHTNVAISLSRKTTVGETIIAKIYNDNGDSQFDPNSDEAVKDSGGNAVKAQTQVTAEADGFQIPATGLGEDNN